MGFEEGSIAFERPTGTYYPGETVNGRVIFELIKVMKVRGIHLKVKGCCKVHWTSQRSRKTSDDRTEHYTVNHNSYEEYLKLDMYLVGNKSGEVNLNPGKYDFPFSFHLPDTSPSSYESEYATIRYQVKAVADIPFKLDQDILRSFTVAANVDLNKLDCDEPVDFQFDQSFCCWCVSSGTAQTLVKLPARGFCPGQEIDVEVSSRNTSTVELDAIKFEIKRVVNYTAANEHDTKSHDEKILSISKGPVPPHTDRAWEVTLPLPVMDVYALDACSYIDIKYKLKVTIETGGCHTDEDDSCYLQIGTVPLRGLSDAPGLSPGQLPQTANYYPPAVVDQPLLAQNPYPGVTSYPQPNPPVSPYPQPYPVGNQAPYPNTSPYPPQNPSPYPAAQNPSPYPAAQNPSPYPAAQNPSPYPAAQNPSPYPAAQNPSPYPAAQNPSPYPAAQNPSPYPPAQNPSPYPPAQNPSPYPASPYPGPSPYSAGASPGLTNNLLVKSDNPGFGGSPVAVPALPPGAAVPYPPPASSPYATASAPVPATPDSDLKNPEYNVNNSPFNPEFKN